MEEMERVWEEMFRSNAAAVARLHSQLRPYDRSLSSLLLSHAITPPLWLLPDPGDAAANGPSQIQAGASSRLPRQPAEDLASQRETGLDVLTGNHQPVEDNDEEPVCENGIPNTITKYKEDQKIVWHGTPFEVRVEKALSDEKHLPRKQGSS